MKIICWPGGNSSTAMRILAHENNIKIDKIIMSEVMFDIKNNISNEDEEHMEFVRNVAIPKFEKWGYKVEILHDKEDYLSLFFKKIIRGKRVGKLTGFPIGGKCILNDRCKMRPIKQFLKEHKGCIEYVGIAIDEPKRLKRLHQKENKISLLKKYKYTESMAYDLCKKYNLLSPIYFKEKTTRNGCWNCPNQSIFAFMQLKLEKPKKWEMLRELSKTPNLCSYGFKYGMTFEELEKRVNDLIAYEEIKKRQIKMW